MTSVAGLLGSGAVTSGEPKARTQGETPAFGPTLAGAEAAAVAETKDASSSEGGAFERAEEEEDAAVVGEGFDPNQSSESTSVAEEQGDLPPAANQAEPVVVSAPLGGSIDLPKGSAVRGVSTTTSMVLDSAPISVSAGSGSPTVANPATRVGSLPAGAAEDGSTLSPVAPAGATPLPLAEAASSGSRAPVPEAAPSRSRESVTPVAVRDAFALPTTTPGATGSTVAATAEATAAPSDPTARFVGETPSRAAAAVTFDAVSRGPSLSDEAVATGSEMNPRVERPRIAQPSWQRQALPVAGAVGLAATSDAQVVVTAAPTVGAAVQEASSIVPAATPAAASAAILVAKPSSSSVIPSKAGVLDGSSPVASTTVASTTVASAPAATASAPTTLPSASLLEAAPLRNQPEVVPSGTSAQPSQVSSPAQQGIGEDTWVFQQLTEEGAGIAVPTHRPVGPSELHRAFAWGEPAPQVVSVGAESADAAVHVPELMLEGETIEDDPAAGNLSPRTARMVIDVGAERLNVTVSTRGSSVHVETGPVSPELARALREDAPVLRHALEQHSLDLSSFSTASQRDGRQSAPESARQPLTSSSPSKAAPVEPTAEQAPSPRKAIILA